MRSARYSKEQLLKEAETDLADWASQHRLDLNRATEAEREEQAKRAIAKIALEHTPRHNSDMLLLAAEFTSGHFLLATEPLEGYSIAAIGVLAACFRAWLVLRLSTYWSQQIEPSMAGYYRSLNNAYVLVVQDSFGWKEENWAETEPQDLARKLAEKLLNDSEYGSGAVYRILHVIGGAERPLLEFELKKDPMYYVPPEDEEVVYHVWTGNWNHAAGFNFALARALMAAEFLRATRHFTDPVYNVTGDNVSLLIVDQGAKPSRTVWEVRVTTGTRIGAVESDEA